MCGQRTWLSCPQDTVSTKSSNLLSGHKLKEDHIMQSMAQMGRVTSTCISVLDLQKVLHAQL